MEGRPRPLAGSHTSLQKEPIFHFVKLDDSQMMTRLLVDFGNATSVFGIQVGKNVHLLTNEFNSKDSTACFESVVAINRSTFAVEAQQVKVQALFGNMRQTERSRSSEQYCFVRYMKAIVGRNLEEASKWIEDHQLTEYFDSLGELVEDKEKPYSWDRLCLRIKNSAASHTFKISDLVTEFLTENLKLLIYNARLKPSGSRSKPLIESILRIGGLYIATPTQDGNWSECHNVAMLSIWRAAMTRVFHAFNTELPDDFEILRYSEPLSAAAGVVVINNEKNETPWFWERPGGKVLVADAGCSTFDFGLVAMSLSEHCFLEERGSYSVPIAGEAFTAAVRRLIRHKIVQCMVPVLDVYKNKPVDLKTELRRLAPDPPNVTKDVDYFEINNERFVLTPEGKKELDVWTDIIDAEGMKRFVLDADSPPRHATPLYTAQHDVFGGTLQITHGEVQEALLQCYNDGLKPAIEQFQEQAKTDTSVFLTLQVGGAARTPYVDTWFEMPEQWGFDIPAPDGSRSNIITGGWQITRIAVIMGLGVIGIINDAYKVNIGGGVKTTLQAYLGVAINGQNDEELLEVLMKPKVRFNDEGSIVAETFVKISRSYWESDSESDDEPEPPRVLGGKSLKPSHRPAVKYLNIYTLPANVKRLAFLRRSDFDPPIDWDKSWDNRFLRMEYAVIRGASYASTQAIVIPWEMRHEIEMAVRFTRYRNYRLTLQPIFKTGVPAVQPQEIVLPSAGAGARLQANLAPKRTHKKARRDVGPSSVQTRAALARGLEALAKQFEGQAPAVLAAPVQAEYAAVEAGAAADQPDQSITGISADIEAVALVTMLELRNARPMGHVAAIDPTEAQSRALRLREEVRPGVVMLAFAPPGAGSGDSNTPLPEDVVPFYYSIDRGVFMVSADEQPDEQQDRSEFIQSRAPPALAGEGLTYTALKRHLRGVQRLVRGGAEELSYTRKWDTVENQLRQLRKAGAGAGAAAAAGGVRA